MRIFQVGIFYPEGNWIGGNFPGVHFPGGGEGDFPDIIFIVRE